MANTVEVIIKGVDKLSPVMNTAGKSMSSLSGIAKGALTLGLGAATAAAGALVAGLKFSIDEAMEAQQVQAQLGAVLESTGGVAGVTAQMANDLATSLSQVTTFSDETIVSAESLMLTFTKVGQEVFPQSIEAAMNMSTALGQDLNSSVIMLGKALNDPIAGITAMTRAGIQFTAEQKDMIKSLVETGDLVGAQTIILAELETQFGGAAEAAGATFAGGLEIAKNAMANIAEEAGNELLPVLTDLGEEALPALTELMEDLAEDVIPDVIETVKDLGGGLVDLIVHINDLRGAVEDAGDEAIDTNQSYEDYLETVGEGGTVHEFATEKVLGLLGSFVGLTVPLNMVRSALGILTEEEYANAAAVDFAAGAYDGWTVALEDGTMGAYGATAATVELSESTISLEDTLISAAQETLIMTEIVDGLKVSATGAAGEVDYLVAQTQDLGNTNANILDDIQNTIDALFDYASPEMFNAKLMLDGIVKAFEAGALTADQAEKALREVQTALVEGTPVVDTWAGKYLGLSAPDGPLEAFKSSIFDATSGVLDLGAALNAAAGNYEANFTVNVTGDPIPNTGGGTDPGNKGGPPKKGAHGFEDFIVPPGYPNDSYPIMVESGERVTVQTEAQQRAGERQRGAATVQNFYGLTIRARGGMQSTLSDLALFQRLR